MHIHPDLWPALIGAILGLPLIIWSALWYARRFREMPGARRWSIGIALALFETAYWLNLYAWFVEPNRLVMREVTIVSEQWQGAPLRLAVLGDTHVGGPHVSVARMGRVVSRINALEPDLVVLLGDYAASHESEAERSGLEQSKVLGGIGTFAGLDAPLGVIGVIGNHDVWYSRSSIAQAMQEAGIATLWNRNVVVARDGGDFVVAGLADADTGDPDFAAALDGAPETDTLILSHSPDPFVDMPRGPALMLAAHTHCGQVYVPFLGRPIVPSAYGQRFVCGRIEEAGRVMYVTGGLGTSILPLRFLTPPEIVIITLRGASN
jgi:predicted MPP superfamily phosphohydrolase